MGTNFYVKIPIKHRQKTLQAAEKFVKLLKEDKLDKYDVQDFCTEIQENFKDQYIHLGKRSCGWAFCWDANELKYYEPTLASIKKFIDDNDGIIVDEYNEVFTWDQFINDEIGYCLHPKENITITRDDGSKFETHCYTYETYVKAHPEEYTYFTCDIEQYMKFNYERFGTVNYKYQELITKENLRFSLYTDFS